MAHPRKLIRHAIVALLKGATDAGQRVDGTRTEPHRKTPTGVLFPAISVYTLREPVDTDKSGQTSPRALYRAAKVEIVIWVSAPAGSLEPTDLADPMDDMCEQVEAAMEADRYLGGLQNGLARDTILENTELAVRGGEGADPMVGVVTLTYSVEYRSTPAKLATDEFLRAHVKNQMPGVEDAGAAVSDINVRQST